MAKQTQAQDPAAAALSAIEDALNLGGFAEPLAKGAETARQDTTLQDTTLYVPLPGKPANEAGAAPRLPMINEIKPFGDSPKVVAAAAAVAASLPEAAQVPAAQIPAAQAAGRAPSPFNPPSPKQRFNNWFVSSKRSW